MNFERLVVFLNLFCVQRYYRFYTSQYGQEFHPYLSKCCYNVYQKYWSAFCDLCYRRAIKSPPPKTMLFEGHLKGLASTSTLYEGGHTFLFMQRKYDGGWNFSNTTFVFQGLLADIEGAHPHLLEEKHLLNLGNISRIWWQNLKMNFKSCYDLNALRDPIFQVRSRLTLH